MESTTTDANGRPLEVFTLSALVHAANQRLGERDPDIEPLTERTVRYYMSRGLLHKGFSRSQIADGAVIHPTTEGHGGNTRFFVVDDIEAAVSIKLKVAQGRPLDEIGYAGPARTVGSPVDASLSPDLPSASLVRSMSARGMKSSSDPWRAADAMIASEMLPGDRPRRPVRVTRPAVDVEPEISSDSNPLPSTEDTWTLRLHPGLSLHGSGPKPTPAAIRQLMRFTDEHLPYRPPHTGETAGRLRVDIELNDIVAPFKGVVVNASNAEVRPGGGVAGRIWEVCGDAELDLERSRISGALPLRPGDAVFTGPGRGADLGFEGVIHAHGPRWLSGFDRRLTEQGRRQLSEHGEEEALIATWQSVLRVADEHGVRQIAAPMISSGIFGYPVPDNFEIAFHTLFTTPTRVERIVIRTISRKTFDQLKESRRTVRDLLGIG